MARFTTFFFALVAVLASNFHLRLVNAAPLKLGNGRAPRDITLDTPPLVTSAFASAMIDDAVEFAPEAYTAANAEPESTIILWETTTVTAQPTATTVPDDHVGSQSQAWVLPETFTDLSPFSIKRIAYGSPNIAVVTGIPARASATTAPPGSPTPVAIPSDFMAPKSVLTAPEFPRPWTNTSAVYRVFFPSGSINPGNKPQGGSDFYAAPLSLQSATNVTLEYSIFFPADFEWVQGGKLPGLYGGHGGCSGGNDAKTCFSTRMMWRPGGAGELYLYAPKDKQTTELCQAPPQSVCDATYGLSVGRGSFHFAAGGWTHMRQTVRLNTPGKQDGGFELVVNGQRIMRRDDVFYRDVPSSSDHGSTGSTGGDAGDGGNGGDSDGGWGGDGGWNGEGGNGGDVGNGDNEGGLLGDLLKRKREEFDDELPFRLRPFLPAVTDEFGNKWGSQAPLFAPEAVPNIPGETIPTQQTSEGPRTSISTNTKTVTSMTTVTMTQSAQPQTSTALGSIPQVQMESQGDTPDAIGFSGIFFSTFFGGHEPSWASPKDQFTYYKDFGMTVNG